MEFRKLLGIEYFSMVMLTLTGQPAPGPASCRNASRKTDLFTFNRLFR
jgi:hypothetical protein